MIDLTYNLPVLDYSFDSLEPFFDRKTMEIHYTKHHQLYLNNLIMILKEMKLYDMPIDYIIENYFNLQLYKNDILRNNLGGHINHSFFWKILKKNTIFSGYIQTKIISQFQSYSNFQKIFENTAMKHFGSGWIWLVQKNDQFSIITTSNQETPILISYMFSSRIYPILGLDLWEHAYYLKYQNNRLSYIQSFWSIVNWDEVNRICLSLKQNY